ncbi:hypothetical protein [Streptosporangium sp. NPDC051022]|uniref:hypothetical protein n=1 Tax=Streptosporangium sp. NPDC051022 TaxID=3155752 RepID=UPI00342E14FE
MRSGALVAAALLVAVGATFPAQADLDPDPDGGADQAARPTCGGWIHSNYDDRTGEVVRAGNMKVGPYAECDNATYAQVGTYLYYWCYAVNGYGHRWTYARVAGSSRQGWLPQGYLSNGGSTRSCNGIGGPELPASLMYARDSAGRSLRIVTRTATHGHGRAAHASP